MVLGRGYRAWPRALHLWQSYENLPHEVVTVWTPLVWVVFWLRSRANKSRFNLTAVSDFFGEHMVRRAWPSRPPRSCCSSGMQVFRRLAPMEDYRPSCRNPAHQISYFRRESISTYRCCTVIKGSASMICCRSGPGREAGRQLRIIMKTRPTPAKYRASHRSTAHVE